MVHVGERLCEERIKRGYTLEEIYMKYFKEVQP